MPPKIGLREPSSPISEVREGSRAIVLGVERGELDVERGQSLIGEATDQAGRDPVSGRTQLKSPSRR